jgi:hypothetical protein
MTSGLLLPINLPAVECISGDVIVIAGMNAAEENQGKQIQLKDCSRNSA